MFKRLPFMRKESSRADEEACTPIEEREMHLDSPVEDWSEERFFDTAKVTVDKRMPVTFELLRTWLAQTSPYLSRALEQNVPSINTKTGVLTEAEPITLDKVYISHFHDFYRWLQQLYASPHALRCRESALDKATILPHPNTGNAYAVEHDARRLTDALALGNLLESIDYQNAAIRGLHALGPRLEWPEDLVDPTFAATKSCAPKDAQRSDWPLPSPSTDTDSSHTGHSTEVNSHPAQRLIVAIIAAKTCGTRKRRVRQGPRHKNAEGGDRVKGTSFWQIYDAYCRESGGECAYPEKVGGFLLPSG